MNLNCHYRFIDMSMNNKTFSKERKKWIKSVMKRIVVVFTLCYNSSLFLLVIVWYVVVGTFKTKKIFFRDKYINQTTHYFHQFEYCPKNDQYPVLLYMQLLEVASGNRKTESHSTKCQQDVVAMSNNANF